jgi:hypothetical protein
MDALGLSIGSTRAGGSAPRREGEHQRQRTSDPRPAHEAENSALIQRRPIGSFIEFEAVAPAGSDLSRETKQVTTLRRAFEIETADVIDGSYSDLALALDGVVIGP